MKVDLAMWAKNGERFLPRVLRQIETAIPEECVHQRIFVDDSSSDLSVQIALDFNWTVYPNREGYISGGCREALKHVDCDYFVGLEQDILLAENWWERITPHMRDASVAVAQGIRIASDPVIRLLEVEEQDSWSFDNNLHRSRIAKKIGFRNEPLGVDGWYKQDIALAGYKWIVDPSVVSIHLRPGVRYYVRHEHIFNMMAKTPPTLSKLLRLAATSPMRGLQLAIKNKVPSFTFAYPYVRLMFLKDGFERRKVRDMPHGQTDHCNDS